MWSKLTSVALGVLTVGSWSSAAIACSPPLADTDAQILNLARESYAKADVVADVVVEMPANLDPTILGAMPLAAIRPTKVWKGDLRDLSVVAVLSMCDIPLDREGAHHRLVLKRLGSDDWIFTADGSANGGSTRDRAVFNREIDRLIGTRRGPDIVNAGYLKEPSATAKVLSPPSPFSDQWVQLAGLAVAVLSSLATWLAARRWMRRQS